MKITDYIPYGRANAISMRELSERRNVDPRTLRAIIQREREQGAPICSDFEQGGYFMPTDKGEALRYFRAQNARIRTARAALNGVRDYLKKGGGTAMNNIPRMESISNTAALFHLPVHFVRSAVANGDIVSVRAGRKILVNLDSLAAFLNTGIPQGAASQQAAPITENTRRNLPISLR